MAVITEQTHLDSVDNHMRPLEEKLAIRPPNVN